MTRVKKREVEGWSLWRDGVTMSFLSNFMECRYQTMLAYCRRLTPIGDSTPLLYGSLCHFLMAELSKTVYKKATMKTIDKLIGEFEEHNINSEMQTQKEAEAWERIVSIARPLMLGYVRYYKQDWKDKEWLYLEKPFWATYRYSDGKEAPIRGVWDGIYRSKEGTTWLFESKVKSRITDQIKELLPHNMQVLLYMWAYRRTHDHSLDGVQYNLVRWSGIKEQSFTKLGERIQQEVVARPSYYFIRHPLMLRSSEVARWEGGFLQPVMEEVRAWYEKRLPTYMNPNALMNSYGKSRFYDWVVYGAHERYCVRESCFPEIEEIR